jgi:hypothetical protein
MRIFLKIFQLGRQLLPRLSVDLVAVVVLTVRQLEWLAVLVQQSLSLLQQQVPIQHLLFVLVTVAVAALYLHQEMVAEQQVPTPVIQEVTTVAPVVTLEILAPLVAVEEVALLHTLKVQVERLSVLLAAAVEVLVVPIMETTQLVIQMAQVEQVATRVETEQAERVELPT